MAPTIAQSVRFPTFPQALYDLHVDSKKHSRAADGPAKMSGKVAANSQRSWDNWKARRYFWRVAKEIVQLWRASHWKKDDWSILVLNFSKVAGGTQVDLVHIGLPRHDQKGLRKGWPKHHWRPWKSSSSNKNSGSRRQVRPTSFCH